MTTGEFKAFIEGMGIPKGEAPSQEQWARIVEKMDGLQAVFSPAAPSLPKGQVYFSGDPWPAPTADPMTVTC